MAIVPSHEPAPVVDGVSKIAVLRANGLGDLMFALPAFAALRGAYPSAEIVLLAREMHRELLLGRPSPLDRVLAVPRSRGVNGNELATDDIPQLERFFAEMREERFDLALQLHGGGRFSNPFLLRLGARVTAGMKTTDAAPLDLVLPYVYLQHEVLRYLEVVAMVGARPTSVEPELAVTEADIAAAFRVMPEAVQPLVAIHPGASDPRRRWPPRRFAALADELAAKGATIVLVGGRDEAEATGRCAAAMRHSPLDLAGRLSLTALVGLLARCSLFIGDDSGPLHLARAVGTATVGVYWCANMLNASPMTRRRHRAIASWRVDCPVCGVDCLRGNCEHRVSFVADVPLEDVLTDALELYEAETAQTAHGASTNRSATVVGNS